MERFSWLLGNLFALIVGMTGLMYILPTDEPALQTIPIEASVVNSVTSNDIEVTTLYYASSEDAYNNFLLQYHGANVASFSDIDTLNSLGYKGYFAWYDITLATHAVLLKGTTVIVIKYIDITVYGNQVERLPKVEDYVLEYLKEKNEI